MKLTILLLLLMAAAVAAAPGVPSLFSELTTAATVQNVKIPDDLVQPVTGPAAKVAAAATGSTSGLSSGWSLKLVRVDKNLLKSKPKKVKLLLPGSDTPLVAVHRPDVAAGPNMWVGELQNAAGPESVVTLAVAADGNVYGNVQYSDKKEKMMRYFLVTPVVWQEGSAAGVASASVASEAAEASRLHMVVEHRGRPDRPHAHPIKPKDLRKVPAKKRLPAKQGLNVSTPHVVPLKRITDRRAGPGKTAIVLAQPAAVAVVAPNAAGGAAAAPQQPASVIAEGAGAGGGRRKLSQSQVEQTLLIVYTKAAAASANGVPALQSLAENAVALMNKAYLESSIPIVVKLVGFREVVYTEPTANSRSASSILDAVTEGDIPNVHAWRDELGADLVSLWNADNTVCGIGWVWGKGNPQPRIGFTAVMRGCWYADTLAHEIGHNHGCNHDYDVDWQGDDWYYEYAHGLRRCDVAVPFSTILSYGDCGWTRATPILLFSNPAVSYKGVPVGDAKKAHCARRITEAAAGIASYRSGGSGGGGGGGCVGAGCCSAGQKLCGSQCIDGSSCCGNPDDCPFTERCDTTTKKCVSKCPVGQKYCGTSSSGKCIPEGTCCIESVIDCQSPFYCPESGKQCVCAGSAQQCGGCPSGTVPCGVGCIAQGTCCSQPDNCPSGSYCSGDGGSCESLCKPGMKLCTVDDQDWCMSEDLCCPSNPDDCPAPFFCGAWTYYSDGELNLDSVGYCRCSERSDDPSKCCPPGTRACDGLCLSDSECCASDDTCGYGTYCPETGAACAPSCYEGWTYCEDFCYSGYTGDVSGSSTPICCLENPKPTCPAEMTCYSSGFECECAQGLKACGDKCIPEDQCCSDDDCAYPGTCNEGSCGCPAGQKLCGSTCIDSTKCCDAADCVSGARCVKRRQQAAGLCQCRNGQKPCAARGRCVANRVRC